MRPAKINARKAARHGVIIRRVAPGILSALTPTPEFPTLYAARTRTTAPRSSQILRHAPIRPGIYSTTKAVSAVNKETRHSVLMTGSWLVAPRHYSREMIVLSI